MYAERKGLKLTDIAIHLSHHRRNLEDFKGGETKNKRMDEIQSQIQLDGDLDDAQRKRLLEIAQRCWMHRALSPGIRIRTNTI